MYIWIGFGVVSFCSSGWLFYRCYKDPGIKTMNSFSYAIMLLLNSVICGLIGWIVR